DEVLVVITAHFFLAEGDSELAKAQLKLVDAMDIYVKVAQRCKRIGEIAFDSEVEVTIQLAFEGDSRPTKKETIGRMVPRLITAEIQLTITADLSFEGSVRASNKGMIPAPTSNRWF